MPDKMYGKVLQDELPMILEAIRQQQARDQYQGDSPPYQMLGEPQTQEQLGQAVVRQAQDAAKMEQEQMGRAIVRMSQEKAKKPLKK